MGCARISADQMALDVLLESEASAAGGAALIGTTQTGWSEFSGATVQAVLDDVDNVLAARTVAYTTRGQIVYRGASAPALLNVGTVGQLLQSNGTDPGWVALNTIDHGAFGGLTDDDHTQYIAKDGRAGGQTLKGGTASGNNLDFEATSHATKGRIRFKDDIELQKQLAINGASATTITGNTNDWNDAVLATNAVVYVDSDAARNITGMTGGTTGITRVIINKGTYALTFKANDTGSTAANRFALGSDYVMAAKTGAIFAHNGTYWYLAGAVTSIISGYTFKGIQRYTTGSGTYTVPANVRAIRVRLIGGGGGGGGVTGATNQTAAGGGGGAGGYTEAFITSPNSTYAYAVGSGGGGGTTSGTNGDAGTDTTFGTTFMTGAGGNGGTGMTAGTALTDVAGGTGGAGSGGDLNISGGTGGFGFRLNSATSWSAPGADSMLGMGNGGTGVRNAAGVNATGYGAGGGGASTVGNTNRAGGSGAGGFIEIEEYY